MTVPQGITISATDTTIAIILEPQPARALLAVLTQNPSLVLPEPALVALVGALETFA